MPSDPYLLLFNFWEKFGQSPYFKSVLIFVGIFFFVVLLALVRKHIFKLSMRGAVFGFVAGIILMLILDLIIVLGVADRVKLGKLTSGENRQEAIQDVFISGVSGLGNILGVSTTTTPKAKKEVTVEGIVNEYLVLPQEEASKFRNLLCPR